MIISVEFYCNWFTSFTRSLCAMLLNRDVRHSRRRVELLYISSMSNKQAACCRSSNWITHSTVHVNRAQCECSNVRDDAINRLWRSLLLSTNAGLLAGRQSRAWSSSPVITRPYRYDRPAVCRCCFGAWHTMWVCPSICPFVRPSKWSDLYWIQTKLCKFRGHVWLLCITLQIFAARCFT